MGTTYRQEAIEKYGKEKIGHRTNDLKECLPMLKKVMPEKDFLNIKITKAPAYFLERLKQFDWAEF